MEPALEATESVTQAVVKAASFDLTGSGLGFISCFGQLFTRSEHSLLPDLSDCVSLAYNLCPSTRVPL